MKLTIPSRRHSLVRVAAVGLAACALLASATAPVLAAPSESDPTPTPTTGAVARPAQNSGDRLEKLYQREQKLLGTQAKQLDRANNLIARAQSRIDQLKGQGRDVSQLDAALSAFKTAVANAQGSYNTAKSALDAHAGFGPNGEVTDASLARSTLKTAGDAMRQFHQAEMRAIRDLQKAMRFSALSARLRAEQARLGAEQKRLDQANRLVTTVQARIDALNGKGKDSSPLVSALASFKSSVGTAQGSYNSAKATLDARAGFDGNGQVTDVGQARSTLRSAQSAIQQFQKTVRQALADLHKAIRGFRAGQTR